MKLSESLIQTCTPNSHQYTVTYTDVILIQLILPMMSMWLPETCKAIPLQVWTGPEGSRRLRLPDFKTTGT